MAQLLVRLERLEEAIFGRGRTGNNFPLKSMEEVVRIEALYAGTAEERASITIEVRALMETVRDEDWLDKVIKEEVLLEFSINTTPGKRLLLELRLIEHCRSIKGTSKSGLTYSLKKVRDRVMKRTEDSNDAFGAVASVTGEAPHRVAHLIMAKSRLGPPEPTSTPKLELSAAVLAALVLEKLRKSIDV